MLASVPCGFPFADGNISGVRLEGVRGYGLE